MLINETLKENVRMYHMPGQNILHLAVISGLAFIAGFAACKITQKPLIEEDDEEEFEEEFEVDSKPLNEVPGECKMALVVRTDLGMTKGKVAAQCAHAAVSLYRMMSFGEVSQNVSLLQRWETLGQAKITLKCPDEEEMDLLYAKAISLNVNSYIVHDAGRTQIPGGSATVLGLGPAPKSVLDEITGELKLY